MKKSLVIIFVTLLAILVSCNKEEKAQLDDLQSQNAELEGTVVEVADAPEVESGPLDIAFDRQYYWVDAAGSVTLNYSLSRPASLEAFAEEGWTATVSSQGGKDGSIVVSAPDPASPSVVTLKVTDGEGVTAESFIQIFIRNPYCNVASPRIEALAYNGFSDAQATLENFQKLADAGMTMITVEGEDLIFGPGWRRQCELAAQTGIKVVLFINYTAGLYSDDPENYKGLDALVAEAKQYPAVCAYQIADEPSTAIGNRLATAKQRINELDPAHPVYINLHPSGVSQAGMGAQTYEDYVEYFATVCNLEFISFDQYPVFRTGVQDGWYNSLDVVSSTAKRHGVPFWAFLLCSRLYNREDPTLENIRLQGNMNLVYGAQCNQFFVWKCLSDSDYAPFMNDGTYRQAYYDCQAYNREMHSRDFVFAGCVVSAVRHIGSDYYLHGPHLQKADLPEVINGIDADGSAVVSFLSNGGNEYVAICNKSWKEKLSVDIEFTREVYTVDREGEFHAQAPGKAQFTIDEGDMLVVKWR